MLSVLETPLSFTGTSFFLLWLELWRISYGVMEAGTGDLLTFQRRMESCAPDFSPELKPFRPELYGK